MMIRREDMVVEVGYLYYCPRSGTDSNMPSWDLKINIDLGIREMGKWGNSTKTLKPQPPTPITQHLIGLNVKLSIEERPFHHPVVI